MDTAEAHTIWRLDLPDVEATQRLAREIATIARANDLITLSGDLGAGKTTFARELIRDILGDPDLEVPSPTFTLMQVYEGPKFPVVHADLYRIERPDELQELGWDEAADGALVLVEWADRAGDQLPAHRLDLALSLDASQPEEFRAATITGFGAFAARIADAKAAHDLLANSDWKDAQRAFMLGDASTRAYERLTKPNGEAAILMIFPPRPDGPPVRNGKPYSAIARLAEDMKPFVAVDHALRARGLSAPEIHACDLDHGLAILEDLGADGVTNADGPIPDRYAEAVGVLASLHGATPPATLPLPNGTSYAIPPYDMDALLIEVELILEWFASDVAEVHMASGARAIFVDLWRRALEDIVEGERTWTLRDYHSPNLIWLEHREGPKRVGIIDFQDCVMGHPAYDVASLLQDARVTVSDELELRLLSQYARARREADPAFDMAAFARAYAVLGAQRATKILGVFARLNRRDGKPQYLAHTPRVRRYLAKSLAHPVLSTLKSWYQTHLPRAIAP